MEEQLKLYFSLGNALYKFYDGQTLTNEELTLIASSSDHDKLIALNFNAGERLRMRTDQSLAIFSENSKSLEFIKFDNKEREMNK